MKTAAIAVVAFLFASAASARSFNFDGRAGEAKLPFNALLQDGPSSAPAVQGQPVPQTPQDPATQQDKDLKRLDAVIQKANAGEVVDRAEIEWAKTYLPVYEKSQLDPAKIEEGRKRIIEENAKRPKEEQLPAELIDVIIQLRLNQVKEMVRQIRELLDEATVISVLDQAKKGVEVEQKDVDFSKKFLKGILAQLTDPALREQIPADERAAFDELVKQHKEKIDGDLKVLDSAKIKKATEPAGEKPAK